MTHPFVGIGHLPEKQFLPPVARRPLLDALEEILKTEPRTDLRRYARTRYLELTDPCNDNERLEK